MKAKRVAIVVGLILLIPLFGNIFVEGWSWGFFDFIIMGALLFGTGLGIDFVGRKFKNPVYRAIAITVIILALLAVWVELAVDGISQFFLL